MPLIDTDQATVDLAIRCIEYLCQRHHDPLLSNEQVCAKVLSGQYSLDAFASQMWFELSCQYLRSVKASEISISLVESIRRLWECRKLPALQQVIEATSNEEHHSDSEYDSEDEVGHEWMPEGMKQQHPLLHNLLRRVYLFRHSSFIYTGEARRGISAALFLFFSCTSSFSVKFVSLTKNIFGSDHLGYEQDPLSILNTSKRVRQILDQKLCNEPNANCESDDPAFHENCADILHYYGKRPFKCKFPRCEFWRQGFEKRNIRIQHERSHENPLKCHVPGCKYGKIGFLSEKVRKKHIQEGHSNDLPQPIFDALDLEDDSVEPLLHYLVAENRVEEVRSILSTLPGWVVYRTEYLRMLASSTASPAMLQLLGEHGSPLDPTQCVVESIKGRNEMTMAYNLNQLQEPIEDRWRGLKNNPLCQLMSNGWLAGLKLWCKASRQQLEAGQSHFGKFPRSTVVKWRLSDPRILEEAAKHPDGEGAVLFLWKESGLLSYISDIPDWASRLLRHVARLGLSVTLATELLNRGASVNFQPQCNERTALHCAARNNSAEGAEMMRFLLLKGADPEAILKVFGERKWIKTESGEDEERSTVKAIKRIRDEKGAQNIHEWLGKSWDELVEETKHIRYGPQTGESLKAEKTEGTIQN